jgi:hypothetical protein
MKLKSGQTDMYHSREDGNFGILNIGFREIQQNSAKFPSNVSIRNSAEFNANSNGILEIQYRSKKILAEFRTNGIPWTP